MLASAKLIGSGLATISIARTGVRIGLVFAALISAYSRTPELLRQLFIYAILRFALTEAIALFGLIIAFLILYS
jgi:F-type H+-transporting ATPase subunit c